MKTNEVDFQIRLANQKQTTNEHIRTLKKGFEKDLSTLKKNSETQTNIKDKNYREDKTDIVRGFESRIDKTSDLSRLALSRAQREKNSSIMRLKENFEVERQEARQKMKDELDQLVISYEVKLKAKDREIRESKENTLKQAEVKVSNAVGEKLKIQEYYDAKIDEIKEDHDQQIKDIYKKQNNS
jgi:hypothetical protein